MYTPCERVKLPDDSHIQVYTYKHVIITMFSVNPNFRSLVLWVKYDVLRYIIMLFKPLYIYI